MAISYERLYSMAVEHKNGDVQAVEDSIPAALTPAQLEAIPASRWLSAASKAVFSAGFNWSVVDKKWPAHEVAFDDFEPGAIAHWPDERLEQLVSDASIIRHGAKIRSVFENAIFFETLKAEHGSTASYFANWPPAAYVDLIADLKKRGSRLGGTSAQYFLRTMGVPSLILSQSVVQALVREGVVDKAPSSKGTMQKVQQAANSLMEQSARDLTAVSRVLALSVG